MMNRMVQIVLVIAKRIGTERRIVRVREKTGLRWLKSV